LDQDLNSIPPIPEANVLPLVLSGQWLEILTMETIKTVKPSLIEILGDLIEILGGKTKYESKANQCYISMPKHTTL